MQLAHIALYVQDLEGMKDFYVQYFDASANTKYHNPKTGLQTYFLSFSDGARLELMTRPELTPHPQQDAPAAGYNHIAFMLGSRERVDALAQELSLAGCPILSGPRVTGDGYYEASLLDPEGNLLELVA
ncbi:MAG TPA: glyoxalase [Anaerolineaceae bacterium]|nr:MAG: Lactoylglutathione lyase and related lyase [Anaerolineae bacterium 49_20]HAE85632.1 glyoxalase [Anaerolineaceae bacterium]